MALAAVRPTDAREPDWYAVKPARGAWRPAMIEAFLRSVEYGWNGTPSAPPRHGRGIPPQP